MNFNPIIIADLISRGKADLQTGPFGTQLKAKDYVEIGNPVINVRNIGHGDVRNSNLEFIDEKTAERLHVHRLKQGDIVFGRKGAVDRHALINAETDGWFQGSDCLRVRIQSDHVSNEFVSYFFQTAAHKDWMEAMCSFGATMSSLNQDIVKRIVIRMPCIEIQRKIVGILSSYDTLIKTNKLRMALLEALSKQIYQEWFVRLRYPGHEKVKRVKGIPENWEPLTLDDICTIKGGKRLPLGHNLVDQKTDHPYIKSRDIKGGAINETELQFVEDNTFDTIKHYIVNEGDICITIVANIGDVGIVPASLDGAALTENAVKLVGLKRGVSSLYLGYTLLMPYYKEYMQLLAAGAAQSKLGIYKIKAIKLLIPPPELMEAFDAQINPLRKQVHLLEKAIINAQASRDLLLPRIISGNLSVENVDIQFPPGMSEELNADPAAANA